MKKTAIVRNSKSERRIRLVLIVPASILLMILYACQHEPNLPEDGEWPVATPESQGLDGDVLQYYSDLAAGGQYGEMHSFLVIRHGYLVHEAYFCGYDREQAHRVYSVTKTVTCALIGMALAKGNINSISEKMLSFFPQYHNLANMHPWKKAIKVENLLTMQAGFLWNEESTPADSPQNSLYGLYDAPDWYKYILDLPMAHPPGTAFTYNSGCSVLLGGILRRATGSSADDFAEQNLFTPIDIQNFQWEEGSPGICNTGWGLWLRPRDMAKFGELLLRLGSWKGTEVVPTAWVQASLSCHVILDSDYGYGYQIWMMPLRKNPTVNNYEIKIAWGYGGQFIFVIPCLDMVLISTAANFDDDGGAVDFIQEMLARAVTDQ